MQVGMEDIISASYMCSLSDATISFAFTGDGSNVCCDNREIEIDFSQAMNKDYFWTLVFHELAHLICYDTSKYTIYHHELLSKRKMYKYIKRMGLRIERYVDKIAEANMKLWDSKLEFKRAYVSKRDIGKFYEWVEETYGKGSI